MRSRRDFLAASTLLPLASLAAAGTPAPMSMSADGAELSADTLREAERLAGISFTEAERTQLLRTLGELRELLAARGAAGALPNELAPAEAFFAELPGAPAAPATTEGAVSYTHLTLPTKA